MERVRHLPTKPGRARRCSTLALLRVSFVLILASAAPSSPKKFVPRSATFLSTSRRHRTSPDGGSESTSHPAPTTTVVVHVDADEIIDEMIPSSRSKQRGSGGSVAAVKDEGEEGVYKSTHVFRYPHQQQPISPSSSALVRGSRKKKKRKSRLKSEGDSLLTSLVTLTSRTTHGVCRAVNVTGTAASVVTGGVFKLAGAAVLDAVDGMEYASAKSPTEIPGITETYRLLAKGLRKTGKTVYDFGVAAQNMTAEATEAAEETIRNVVESVIETASGGNPSHRDGTGSPLANRTPDYFADEEERIIDNMMFGMSSAAGEGGARNGGDEDEIGYSETDLSTQFGRDTARGHQIGSNNAEEVNDWDRDVEGIPQQQASSIALVPPPESERRPIMVALAKRVRTAIRQSILRTSRAMPSMRFPQMVACGIVFGCRTVTSNPWLGAASFVGARMYLKFVESIYLECLRERMMSDIKFEAVARLHEGSPERARWFNTGAGAMWVPMLEPLLSRWASRQIAMGIERSLPSNVSWVGLGKVTLGPTPPKIRYVQVQNVTSLAARKSLGQSNSVIDSVLLEAGEAGNGVDGEHVVYMELGVDWTSYRSKVSLKLGEQSRRRNWWSVTSYVPSYRVKVCDLGIKAKVIVALAVGEGRPFVKRLWVGFAEPPLTHLSLEALTGMDITNLPVLRKHLKHVVMRCLMPLTEPRHLAIEMKPPPPPPSSYRGAALAARVRPAAAGVRKGVLSRVPGFGIRRLMRNRAEAAAAAAAARGGDLSEAEDEDDTPRRELEEATKRVLVEFGGDCREETVLAAAAVATDGKEGVPLMSAGGAYSPLSATAETEAGVETEAGSKEEQPVPRQATSAELTEGREMRAPEKQPRAKTKGKAKREAKVEPMTQPTLAFKEVLSEQEPSLSEETVDVGVRAGSEEATEQEGEKTLEKDLQKAETERLGVEEKPLSAAKDEGGAERKVLSIAEPATEAADSEPCTTTKTTTTTTASLSSSSSSSPSSSTSLGRNSTLPWTADEKDVLVALPAATRPSSRSEEVRERREEIRRRRAARREEERRELSAPGGNSVLKSLRRWWAGAGRNPKGGPEREEMIRKVCELSRPPPAWGS